MAARWGQRSGAGRTDPAEQHADPPGGRPAALQDLPPALCVASSLDWCPKALPPFPVQRVEFLLTALAYYCYYYCYYPNHFTPALRGLCPPPPASLRLPRPAHAAHALYGRQVSGGAGGPLHAAAHGEHFLMSVAHTFKCMRSCVLVCVGCVNGYGSLAAHCTQLAVSLFGNGVGRSVLDACVLVCVRCIRVSLAAHCARLRTVSTFLMGVARAVNNVRVGLRGIYKWVHGSLAAHCVRTRTVGFWVCCRERVCANGQEQLTSMHGKTKCACPTPTRADACPVG